MSLETKKIPVFLFSVQNMISPITMLSLLLENNSTSLLFSIDFPYKVTMLPSFLLQFVLPILTVKVLKGVIAIT